MCFRVECKQCGKYSWGGCGKHLKTLYGSIDKGKHCMCRSWPGVVIPQKEADTEKQSLASASGNPIITSLEDRSENDSDGGSDVPHMGMGGESNIEVVEYVSRNVGVRDVSMEEYAHDEMNLKENEAKEAVGNDEIAHKDKGRRNELVGDGVVSEKVEKASNEFIMNKVIASKTELVSSEVETKNENEFMQGRVNIEKAEEIVIASAEENETEVMRNEVETKIENELMQGQTNAEKDEEMGTSCTETSNTEVMKNEVEIKNEGELTRGQMNAERDEEMGIASTEKSIGVGD